MRMILNSVVAIGLLGFAGIAPIAAQSRPDAAHSTVQGGAVTVVANSTAGGATIDYIHAKPMKLPTAPGRSEAATRHGASGRSRRQLQCITIHPTFRKAGILSGLEW